MKEVSEDFFKVITKKVQKLELELKTLQEESREQHAQGNTSRNETNLEAQLQKALRTAKYSYKNSYVVPNPKDNETIQIGSQFELLFDRGCKIFRLEGFGGFPGVCSISSLLGSQLIGAKEGDEFMIKNKKIKVVKIIL